jgi:hypothetical protein
VVFRKTTSAEQSASCISSYLESVKGRLCMFDEMKKPQEKISLCIHCKGWERGLVQVVCHSPVLVSYFFMEIQVMEE